MTDKDMRAGRRQLGGELVIPVLAVAFTIYFFTTIWNSPWTAQVSAFAVGGFLLVLCAIFFVRSAIWLKRGEATLGFGNLFGTEDLYNGRAGLFAATLGYVALIDRLGFTLTTFLFLAASMLILSGARRPVFVTWLAAIMALTGWAVFIWAFDTRFPRGWFEETMRAVLPHV